MKNLFYTTVGTLFSTALAALGFSSCNLNTPQPCEYGTPIIKFRVVGQVTDEKGTPIQGIKVPVLRQSGIRYHQLSKECNDSAFTDTQGNFTTQVIRDHSIDKQLVVVEDIDGDQNGGKFETDSIKFSELQNKRIKPGTGSWNWGEYELSGKIKLQKKK